MENNPPLVLPSLANAAYFVATSLLTFAGAVVGFLFRRRLQSAEIHKTSAEAVKTEAETRQIDSAILMRAYERLDDYEEITRRQSGEITELEHRYANLEFESGRRSAKIEELETELKIASLQVQRAKAAGLLEDRPPHSPNPAA